MELTGELVHFYSIICEICEHFQHDFDQPVGLRITILLSILRPLLSIRLFNFRLNFPHGNYRVVANGAGAGETIV